MRALALLAAPAGLLLLGVGLWLVSPPVALVTVGAALWIDGYVPSRRS